MTHEIKINHRFVSDILNGDKRFEIRNNDRAYQRGDLIEFKVVKDDGERYLESKYPDRLCEVKCTEGEVYSIENMIFEITFVISGWGLKNGYVAFGIKECEDND